MYDNTLVHWGVKGQRWGVRRFQNTDGSLTNRGKRKSAIDQSADKVSKRTPDQAKKIKRAKVVVGVVGGLIAADFISAKVTGQPTVTQAVKLLIKTTRLPG